MSEQIQPPDEPPYQQPDDAPPSFTLVKEGSAWQQGFGLSLLLHLLQIPLCLFLSLYDQGASMFSILFIGVSQLFYMIPAIMIAFGKGKKHLAKGLIMGAAMVFLLNAACAGIFFAGLTSSYSR